MVSISKITRKFANHENVSAIFIEPTIFIFMSIILELIWTHPNRGASFIKESPCQLFAWDSVGGRLA
jgi:hypothetical protein